jgi:transcriptional regulator GlxA family with amidase domain
MTTAAQPSSRRIIPVYTILPPHTLLLDVAGPLEVLRYANVEQAEILFDCHYLGTQPQQITSIGLAVTGLRPLPDRLPDGAYVIISGSLSRFNYDPETQVERARITAWLRRTIRPGMTLVTICSGAILAAEAGLFDGHDCTTHADCIAALRQAAPFARVLENRLYVEDGERLSSAGISTGTDLMLQLASRLTSPAVALRIARSMVVYMRRSGSDPQLSPWLSGRNHLHPSIHRVQDAIVADPARDWSLCALAGLACLSERHLSRLFREHAVMSVIDYINLMRVTLAREILSQSRLDIETVAQRAGFSSTRHLRRVWAQHNEAPPSRYRGNAAG